ncbi:MAG: nitrilase-related carbon-nitrogen hydrolase [Prevotellaceae bacterium]|nr:nitrilase-related carbon-nitrogen hydrolase [Prevotellaceae bacterium]
MRVTVLQTDIKWGQPKANQDIVSRLMSAAPRSDVYVLPEMWSTGFTMKPEKDAEDLNCPSSLDWMKKKAEEYNCAICGSIAAKTKEGQYVNRQYFVREDGSYDYYDKRHLFTYGGEDKHYVSGTCRSIAEYKGTRFLMTTCYDLRFPIWMRNNDDYDAIIVTANWPKSRKNVWQILLRARAIENQSYVIGANRTGEDQYCQYKGNSCIIDAKGKTLAQAKEKEQSITADIDLNELNAFRLKFPVLNDKDIFYINQNK